MTFRNAQFSRFFSCRFFGWGAAAGALLAGASLSGQTAISSLQITTSDASNTTQHGITYKDTTATVSQFSTSSATYVGAQDFSTVYVRRNTGVGNADNTSVWYQTDPNDQSRFLGTAQQTLPGLLASNNLYQGVDNAFQNGTSDNSNSSDIERIDFVNTSGVTVSSGSQGFAVFERGVTGQHDNFVIAAITGFNSSTGLVTSYSAPLTVTGSDYGNALTASADYEAERYAYGDNINHTSGASLDIGTQSIGAVFISLSSLGLSAGTTIYGYSIISADVTTTTPANLINWNNTHYYSSDTDSTTGGLDITAFNGNLFRVVPEPSTYGAIFMGLGIAGAAWRRRLIVRRLD